MRVFVQKDNDDEFINENCYVAFFGFATMGWEVIPYKILPPDKLSRSDIVVGWISSVKTAIRSLGITPPVELDYPESLNRFFGRRIWKSTFNTIVNNQQGWPIFMKPVSGKQFNGGLIADFKDLIGKNRSEDQDVWCSEPVRFVSEYRCFIRYKQIVDVRLYKGDWRTTIDPVILQACIEAYSEQPAGFSIDLGVTDTGKTLLIEVNDGYALGSYGLFPVEYAKLISARWSEIVGIPDACLF